ncbi:hypothetical protein FACS1894111_11540 [Clostridia bacterium]|nr:hypothetical protein FACS1894111_11540 [Clostridia bacterium]
MNFVWAFIGYAWHVVLLVGLAIAGIFTGKYLSKRKAEKTATQATAQEGK